MAAKLCDTFGHVTEADISTFEKRHGVSLPSSYKSFLLSANGGRPDRTILNVPGWPGQATAIHYFFGIHDGEENLAQLFRELDDRLPEGFMPIGIDMGGSYLCVGTWGKYKGEIWFWDSSPDYEISPEDGNMYKVAATIWELLEKLELTYLPKEE